MPDHRQYVLMKYNLLCIIRLCLFSNARKIVKLFIVDQASRMESGSLMVGVLASNADEGKKWLDQWRLILASKLRVCSKTSSSVVIAVGVGIGVRI